MCYDLYGDEFYGFGDGILEPVCFSFFLLLYLCLCEGMLMKCVDVGARMLLLLRLLLAPIVARLALVMVTSLVVALGGLLLCSILVED